MPLHAHENAHELIVVVAGRLEARFAGHALVGQKGDLLLYPCGLAHEEQSLGEDPLETYFISWRARAADSFSRSPMRLFDRDDRAHGVLRWMMEIFPPRTQKDAAALESLLTLLLHELARLSQSVENQLALQLKRFAQGNLSRALTLDDLADEAGLSKYHFCRVFRSVAGETPMHFLRRCRVEAARTLLLTTPLPLKAIARQVGFSDEYHFSRTFRQFTGVPPTRMRRQQDCRPKH